MGHRSRIVTALIVAAGALVLCGGIAIRAGGLGFQTVVSNSMRPTISAGDVAVTQAVPADSIRAGDVIAFVPPDGTRTLLHRVTALTDGVITTRGDANAIDDPWQVRLGGPTAYRLVAVVPSLGWLTVLQRPALALAGALVGLGILVELRKEVRARSGRSQLQA